MSKITLNGFVLLLLLFLGNSSGNYAAGSATVTGARAQFEQTTPSLDQGGTGTLQKMIVQSGSVTMQLDLNRLNGISSSVPVEANSSDLQPARPPLQLRFVAAANSFFPVLIFNDQLRGPEPGSIALVPAGGVNASGYNLPVALGASLKQLIIEKLSSDQSFDLAVRDADTGFIFFNVEGHQYDYDPAAKSLCITGGRLLISKEFANAMGKPSDAGSEAGSLSIGAVMQPTEIMQVANGQPQSLVMPSVQ